MTTGHQVGDSGLIKYLLKKLGVSCHKYIGCLHYVCLFFLCKPCFTLFALMCLQLPFILKFSLTLFASACASLQYEFKYAVLRHCSVKIQMCTSGKCLIALQYVCAYDISFQCGAQNLSHILNIYSCSFSMRVYIYFQVFIL